MFRKLSGKAHAIIVAVAFGAMVLSPGTVVAEERPFSAMLSGNAHLSPTEIPWIVRNDETGVGEATHLGRFTWSSVEFVDFSNFPPQVAVEGTFTMTAANGDLLYGSYSTVGMPDEVGNLVIHGSYQFTGGTGRFAAASGSGDLDAVASLAPGLPFLGMFSGTIDF
jgi:hypothetical protein